ncbi:MAG: hypothetical protein Q8O67_19960 [Deltaproteobacteria bacterium]|nr:hypothetical protein [Deltaproteobacteria bacterium]
MEPDKPDDQPEMDPPEDWPYTEDPSAPPTVDGKLTEMGKDLRKLTRASLVATVMVAAAFFVVDVARGQGFGNTCGFLLGGGLATVNLWILAGGYFALIDQRAMLLRVLLAAAGSLTVLLGAALYVLAAHREWTMGFALGLAIPALGGILFGLQKNREEP